MYLVDASGSHALDAGLATALRISISRLARRLRVERLGLGGTETVLSDIQLAALAALERHQAMTPGELAEYEKVQPPSMTRVIAVLEERNLVQREPHPSDRRQVILTVTAEGRSLVNRVRRRREAWLAQRLQELTTEERAILRAAAPILEKLSQSCKHLWRCGPGPGDGKPAVIYPRDTGAVRTPDSSRRFRGNHPACPASVADPHR